MHFRALQGKVCIVVDEFKIPTDHTFCAPKDEDCNCGWCSGAVSTSLLGLVSTRYWSHLRLSLPWRPVTQPTSPEYDLTGIQDILPAV